VIAARSLATALGLLLGVLGLLVAGLLAGPFVVDGTVVVWAAAGNMTAWLFDHTLVPLAGLFG